MSTPTSDDHVRYVRSDKPATKRGRVTPQSGNYWRTRLSLVAREVNNGIARLNNDIANLAAIAAQEHRPDKLEADAKSRLAEQIPRWIDTLQAIARNLDAHDLDP